MLSPSVKKKKGINASTASTASFFPIKIAGKWQSFVAEREQLHFVCIITIFC